MQYYTCTECDKQGIILQLGTCRRDHPEKLMVVIGKNEDGSDMIWNGAGSGQEIKFRDIDSSELNQTILFNAKVMSTSIIDSYDISKTYVCNGCGEEKTKQCDEYRDIYDKDTISECTACEEATMSLDKSKTIVGNIVKLLLQETIEETALNPRRIEAHVTSNNVFKVQAGKDYRFQAKLWSVSYGKKGNLSRYVLDVMRLKCLDEETDILPTPAELAFLQQTDQASVIESVAPQLIGRKFEKLAAIISYLSGGRVDGIRGDLSVMFVGDPSTGKSDILDYMKSLDLKSFKISGRSASAAGMVMGVDNLPDGTRMATLGPVVLAHNHTVYIDEGDKMKATDQSMLHDVMEEEVAHLNKVGIMMSVPAQTKIVMACNPKSSRYDKEATVMANIGMPDSFLARFGYIFLVLDNFDPEMERQKLRRINEIKIYGMEKFIEKNNLLNKENLMKYLNQCKKINPVFEPSALTKLEDLYIELKYRKQEKGSIAIDTRAYHDIIRASYSFARFRFSNKVEVEDVNNAWKLYSASLDSFGMSTKGEFVDTQLSMRDNTKQQWVDECLEECAMNGMININSLKVKLMEKPKLFAKINIVERTIIELEKEGKLMKTGQSGVYKYNG